MAKFFIDRPVFAWVIAILTIMIGVLCLKQMAIEQYPELSPPTVSVSTTYPGADATTLDTTVTQVIERQLTGLDNMLYMNSSSSSAGSVSISITFSEKADVDQAQNQVSNIIQGVLKSLPSVVQQNGVTVNKSSGSFLKVIAFTSTDPTRTSQSLSDIVYNNVQQEISNVEGVGGTQLFGSNYAMRIWLDPNKLNYYNITLAQVTAAINAQNAQVSVGQLGTPPLDKGQALNITVTGQSHLKSAEQFQNIIIYSTTSGANIYLRDVAEVELGAEDYSTATALNGDVAVGLAVNLASGANQITTSNLVDAKMKQIAPTLPSDIQFSYPYDTTDFVKISIEKVEDTLFEAILLVVLVMFLFLQNIRATFVPTIIIPVVLLGTFSILYAIGFTINTLTMFAIVLAIGLLVDDAIVVVENIERLMHDEHLSAYDATVKSMQQITGALLGIAVVLSSVFVPMAFLGGAQGGIFKQFSLTIVTSMLLSVVFAIVVAPALCTQFLKDKQKINNKESLFQKLSKIPPFNVISMVFKYFNIGYEILADLYIKGVKIVLKTKLITFISWIFLVGVVIWGLQSLNKSFVPNEDQGAFMIMVQLQNNSTLTETQAVLTTVSNFIRTSESKDVTSVFQIAGFSFMGAGSNMGLIFVKLKPWDDRTKAEDKVQAIIGRVQKGVYSQVMGPMIYALNPPPIPGFGNANGLDFVLQNVNDNSHSDFVQTYYQLIGQVNATGKIAARPNTLPDVGEYKVEVDKETAQALGVSIASINSLLAASYGSSYIDDFNHNNNNRKVYIQGDTSSRMSPDNFDLWSVQNSSGEMVPFSSFAKVVPSYGSPVLQRYNSYPAMNVSATVVGVSTGDGMTIFENAAAKLKSKGYSFQWTGLSYQEKEANSILSLIALALFVVFLALAALYESWAIPISVLLSIPAGMLGTVYFTKFSGFDNDVYFIVGLLTTIGLTAKNAILIVEFAKDSIEKEGKNLMDATLEACHLRFRPILMTSMAFIIGVLPLAMSSGAGAASQNEVGVAVIGGMFTATVLAIFYIPLFFVLVMKTKEFLTNLFQSKNDIVIKKK